MKLQVQYSVRGEKKQQKLTHWDLKKKKRLLKSTAKKVNY